MKRLIPLLLALIVSACATVPSNNGTQAQEGTQATTFPLGGASLQEEEAIRHALENYPPGSRMSYQGPEGEKVISVDPYPPAVPSSAKSCKRYSVAERMSAACEINGQWVPEIPELVKAKPVFAPQPPKQEEVIVEKQEESPARKFLGEQKAREAKFREEKSPKKGEAIPQPKFPSDVMGYPED